MLFIHILIHLSVSILFTHTAATHVHEHSQSGERALEHGNQRCNTEQSISTEPYLLKDRSACVSYYTGMWSFARIKNYSRRGSPAKYMMSYRGVYKSGGTTSSAFPSYVSNHMMDVQNENGIFRAMFHPQKDASAPRT